MIESCIRRELGLRPKPRWGSVPDPAGFGAEPQRPAAPCPSRHCMCVVSVWHHLMLILECLVLSGVVSWFYRPQTNQVFALHPRQQRNPHNAARRSFINGRPQICAPRLETSTVQNPTLDFPGFSHPPPSPSVKSIITISLGKKSPSAGYGTTEDSDSSSGRNGWFKRGV